MKTLSLLFIVAGFVSNSSAQAAGKFTCRPTVESVSGMIPLKVDIQRQVSLSLDQMNHPRYSTARQELVLTAKDFENASSSSVDGVVRVSLVLETYSRQSPRLLIFIDYTRKLSRMVEAVEGDMVEINPEQLIATDDYSSKQAIQFHMTTYRGNVKRVNVSCILEK